MIDHYGQVAKQAYVSEPQVSGSFAKQAYVTEPEVSGSFAKQAYVTEPEVRWPMGVSKHNCCLKVSLNVHLKV